MPKAFAARFSDLSGPTNPTGILSPAYLALKQTLDSGDSPDNVLQALYDWLGRNGLKPDQVDRLVDLEPEDAYEALVALIGAKTERKPLDAKRLSDAVRATLMQALRRVAQLHVQGREQEMTKEQERLGSLKARYGLESAPQIVRRLLRS